MTTAQARDLINTLLQAQRVNTRANIDAGSCGTPSDFHNARATAVLLDDAIDDAVRSIVGSSNLLAAAVGTLINLPVVRAYLEAHGPKALAQAKAALRQRIADED